MTPGGKGPRARCFKFIAPGIPPHSTKGRIFVQGKLVAHGRRFALTRGKDKCADYCY